MCANLRAFPRDRLGHGICPGTGGTRHPVATPISARRCTRPKAIPASMTPSSTPRRGTASTPFCRKAPASVPRAFSPTHTRKKGKLYRHYVS